MEPKKNLIVDDEKNIRLTLSQALETLGMPVQTAVDGEEALQKFQDSDFSTEAGPGPGPETPGRKDLKIFYQWKLV
jgi:CheY-like chemotaxis protein